MLPSTISLSAVKPCFQSPFHRGKECYSPIHDPAPRRMPNFQSPFHRGKECYASKKIARRCVVTFSPLFIGARNVTPVSREREVELELSVPFSSGQGMLHAAGCFHRVKSAVAFSPLFIGARNVTVDKSKTSKEIQAFQSPFHRGKECYNGTIVGDLIGVDTFSPLFIGARNVTWIYNSISPTPGSFSPLFIGARNVT